MRKELCWWLVAVVSVSKWEMSRTLSWHRISCSLRCFVILASSDDADVFGWSTKFFFRGCKKAVNHPDWQVGTGVWAGTVAPNDNTAEDGFWNDVSVHSLVIVNATEFVLLFQYYHHVSKLVLFLLTLAAYCMSVLLGRMLMWSHFVCDTQSQTASKIQDCTLKKETVLNYFQ